MKLRQCDHDKANITSRLSNYLNDIPTIIRTVLPYQTSVLPNILHTFYGTRHIFSNQIKVRVTPLFCCFSLCSSEFYELRPSGSTIRTVFYRYRNAVDIHWGKRLPLIHIFILIWPYLCVFRIAFWISADYFYYDHSTFIVFKRLPHKESGLSCTNDRTT